MRVHARIEFPQTGFSNQLWYQVSGPNSSTPLGWIPARYEDASYVSGVTTGSDPCSSVATPATISFQYDRAAAANYAIEHSWQNDALADPLDDGRVTRRLTNNQSGTPIPFANFPFSYLTGANQATGSAVFVSEAIWAGGMPMTVGAPDSCSNGNRDTEAGWRYCSGNSGSSNPWDWHRPLVSYFTNSQAPQSNLPNSVLLETGFPLNKGERINFPGPPTTRYADAVWGGRNLLNEDNSSDLSAFIPDLRAGVVTDASGLAAFATAHLQSLKAGDYLLTDPLQEDFHGMFIVGWAAIENCSVSVGTRRTINNILAEYSTSATNIVPYVVDFNRLQSPTPRPFYCSQYKESSTSFFARHDWRFYKMPSSVTLSTAKVYVDPNWQWSSTDGN